MDEEGAATLGNHAAPHAEGGAGLWEVRIPLAVAAIPAACFWLMRFINDRIAAQGAATPDWMQALASCLLLAGSVEMAVVLLIRFDQASKRLSELTNGSPSIHRRATLLFAMVMLLVFDLTVNLATAFAGGAVLLLVGVPAFLAYVILGRLALSGLAVDRRDRD